MTEAQAVQQRMAQVRENLADDVEEIVDNAETLSDWRYYVRSHPWMFLGAAAVAGYLVVPRRRRTMSPDAETLAALANEGRLVVQPQAAPRKQRGLISSLLMNAGVALGRQAVTRIVEHAGKLAEQHAAGSQSPDPAEYSNLTSAKRPQNPR